MAKANAKPTPISADVVTVSIPSDFTIGAHGHELSVNHLANMSPEGVAYLIANGFTQSLTDAAAMSKESKKGKSDNEVAKIASDKRASRYEAILSGSVGAVRGTRATPIDKYIKDVALARIKRGAAKNNQPMPKGKPLAALVAAVIAGKHGADIRAEAEARKSADDAASESVDWNDLVASA